MTNVEDLMRTKSRTRKPPVYCDLEPVTRRLSAEWVGGPFDGEQIPIQVVRLSEHVYHILPATYSRPHPPPESTHE